MGMENSNFLTLKHTVDGDKEGKEAKSQLELDKSLLEMVLPDSTDSDTSPDSE